MLLFSDFLPSKLALCWLSCITYNLDFTSSVSPPLSFFDKPELAFDKNFKEEKKEESFSSQLNACFSSVP